MIIISNLFTIHTSLGQQRPPFYFVFFARVLCEIVTFQVYESSKDDLFPIVISRELKVQFENLLKAISKILCQASNGQNRYYIFIDGLEMLEKGRFANFLDFLPDHIPKVSSLCVSVKIP